MRFRFGRVSTLVCFFLLLFSGGVLFAKPGDYLVCALDPQKDSSLKCCCCECTFTTSIDCPSLCFLKYEEGGNVETVFESAKEFNLHEAGKIRSKFFEVVKSKDYCSVVEELKIVLKDMKGLFCKSCMESVFEVNGIFEWKEFLFPHTNARYDRDILSNCDVCGKELNSHNRYIDSYCGKCSTYFCCSSCYFGGRTACPVCSNATKSGSKIIKRQIPYLLDKSIQKTSDDGTEVKTCMECGVSVLPSVIFNCANMKFMVRRFFVDNEEWFEKEIELSEEEKKYCCDIPETTNKFHFVCSLSAPKWVIMNGAREFEETSKKIYDRYHKRFDRYGPKMEQNNSSKPVKRHRNRW